MISGKYKGHPLKAVPGKQTRPTTDKVKEAIFQIIGPYFNGGIALDLFAGSGGLGIEAISRGASKAIFVDQQPLAIKTVNANIKQLQIDEVTEVYRADAFRALKAASKRDLVFDWIFLDPPYKKISFDDLFQQLIELKLVHTGSIIVCEHAPDHLLPEKFENLQLFKTQGYGKEIQVSYYHFET